MTITLARELSAPLSQRFAAVESVISAAEHDLFELHMLEAARLVRDPFPDATQLLIVVDPSDMKVTLQTVHCGDQLLLVADLAGTGQPEYRTGDGADLTQLLTAVETALETALTDRYPQDLWPQAEQNHSYRVPLPSHDLAQHMLTTPPPTRSTPRVEVIIDRESDSDTNAVVFVDGEQHDPEIVAVDPGRGYDLTTWRQLADDCAHKSSPAAATLIRRWFARAESNEHITD